MASQKPLTYMTEVRVRDGRGPCMCSTQQSPDLAPCREGATPSCRTRIYRGPLLTAHETTSERACCHSTDPSCTLSASLGGGGLGAWKLPVVRARAEDCLLVRVALEAAHVRHCRAEGHGEGGPSSVVNCTLYRTKPSVFGVCGVLTCQLPCRVTSAPSDGAPNDT